MTEEAPPCEVSLHHPSAIAGTAKLSEQERDREPLVECSPPAEAFDDQDVRPSHADTAQEPERHGSATRERDEFAAHGRNVKRRKAGPSHRAKKMPVADVDHSCARSSFTAGRPRLPTLTCCKLELSFRCTHSARFAFRRLLTVSRDSPPVA